jgi:hypothetical protein
MKTRHALWLIIMGLGLVGGLTLLLWLWQSDETKVFLKTVRWGTDQGRPVVFFKLEGAKGRRILIGNVERVVNQVNEGPFEGIHLFDASRTADPSVEPSWKTGHPGIWTPTENFWPSSQPWPLHDPKKGRREFALLALTNGQSWNVRVTVNVERVSLGERISNMPRFWKPLRQAKYSLWRAAWSAWNTFYQFDSYVVESATITNAVTPEASATVRHRVLGK